MSISNRTNGITKSIACVGAAYSGATDFSMYVNKTYSEHEADISTIDNDRILFFDCWLSPGISAEFMVPIAPLRHQKTTYSEVIQSADIILYFLSWRRSSHELNVQDWEAFEYLFSCVPQEPALAVVMNDGYCAKSPKDEYDYSVDHVIHPEPTIVLYSRICEASRWTEGCCDGGEEIVQWLVENCRQP